MFSLHKNILDSPLCAEGQKWRKDCVYSLLVLKRVIHQLSELQAAAAHIQDKSEVTERESTRIKRD